MPMSHFDIIVIGAGPAGLFAAVNCEQSKKVLILEKKSSPGKKFLLSGSGQCNLTHAGNIKDFLSHYGLSRRFLKHALFSFTNSDLLSFFKKKGSSFFLDKNDKYFPESLKASELLHHLTREISSKKIEIKLSAAVNSVVNKDGNFIIKSGSNIYTSSKVIIATGGKSFPVTGSSGAVKYRRA